MTHDRLQWLKLRVRRLWILSPEKLWLASIAAHRRGHLVLAFWLKQLNGFLYHNSLAPGASVGRDIFLGHNSLGIVISPAVEIGSAVVIWHNVTLIAGRPERHLPPEAQAALEPDAQASSAASPLGRIIVEDGVRIGANAVLIAPRAQTLRIGRGAFIGAGTVVTKNIPAHARIVGAAPRLLVDADDVEGADEFAPASAPEARESNA